MWVLPGGTPGKGESAGGAARREVAEETGLQVAAERVAFVLETTSWDGDQYLIEIVFLGSERDVNELPRQLEERLEPVFVPVEELDHIPLRPPIGGYIRGLVRSGGARAQLHRNTASYLGNVWRPTERASGSE